jgi:hypothetical protein
MLRGALKHSSERFTGAEPGRHRVGSLATEDTGDIDELQAGLAGERFERLRERLCGNVGGERSGFMGLGQRWGSIDEHNGRTDRERAQHRRRHCCDVR